ncbi:sporulation inhibitor of replication protein SirA [Bacillus fonticola]|uniref:sporulation inhibitor of replication protein SirA n=1 Tax=Bacillus fonticola TaxID=2728853 RepID=UPI001472EB8B|nr:sporulation inhibitor of replication protein SirA [Bacillus fonticola]
MERHYTLYSIKAEVANFFYGREGKFVQLFLECEQAEGRKLDILKRQVTYILEPVPNLQIQRELHKLVQDIGGTRKGQGVYLQDRDFRWHATIRWTNELLTIDVYGEEEEVDSLLFERLRKVDNFLAIERSCSRYGWLKPRKQQKYV